MKKNLLINLFMILLALLPLMYLAIIWDHLPETVALHFNSRFEPDKTGSKSGLWASACMLAFVSIFIYFLLKNIHKIDPKRRKDPPSSIFNKLGIGLLVFFSALNFIIIYSEANSRVLIKNLLFPVLGLLFAFIGNYMNNIKPNYFAGFRLPWTLSDDNNWRLTHHLASKLWFWCGLFLAVVSLFLPSQIIFPLFLIIIVTSSVIPAVYSYRLFKNKS